jgi:hypothetical protein
MRASVQTADNSNAIFTVVSSCFQEQKQRPKVGTAAGVGGCVISLISMIGCITSSQKL